MMFWALWETTRYCVLSRLRTPFGGPQQTFEAIERSLMDIVRAAEGINEEPNAVSPEMSSTLFHRLRYLLTFVDLLELQLSNAAEGTGLYCPPPPKPSLVFFHTNRK
ncbi:Serine/threonine-protein kinase smg1, partial [Quaeritorhiza haematococci]